MREIMGHSWLRVLPALLVAACASGSGGASQAEPAAGMPDIAVIEVQHNLTSTSSPLTIMIEPQVGVRSSLGVIQPGETRRFTYNANPGNYKLLAQGSISSDMFRLSNREIATWNMQTNRVLPRNK